MHGPPSLKFERAALAGSPRIAKLFPHRRVSLAASDIQAQKLRRLLFSLPSHCLHHRKPRLGELRDERRADWNCPQGAPQRNRLACLLPVSQPRQGSG